MRKELLVDVDTEKRLLELLPKVIVSKYPYLSPENTLVLMVSPDYSASPAMHVAHALSENGEMCSILPIHVPYPDEPSVEKYVAKAKSDIYSFHEFEDKAYDYYLLVEAGVIKGGTYTWLTDLLHNTIGGNVITAALYENVHSKFKSDVVMNYYDDTKEDLTFYFERDNKHWKN